MDAVDHALDLLPPALASAIEKSGTASRLWEIRLRLGSPFGVTVAGDNLFLDAHGRRCSAQGALLCTAEHLQEVLQRATGRSLYRYEDSLRRGFITTSRGIRLGVCGRALPGSDKKEGTGLVSPSSINLRIPHSVPGSADPALGFFRRYPLASTLVIAPPGGGKTTFLRDLALRLSLGELHKVYRVAVVDEREELFYPGLGYPAGALDVLSGYSKAWGLECALRVLNPQVLCCDEIGNPQECEILCQQANAGVVVLATLHGADYAQVTARPAVGKLIRDGVFGYLCFLRREQGVRKAEFFTPQGERLP